MRRYLLSFLLTLTLLCAAGSVVIAGRYWIFWESDGFGLVRYQLAKLRGLPQSDTDTLLLGDSSLGNAIDVDLFNQLTGLRAVKLALTGLYGYAGTYNMAQAALARAPQIRQLVIVQSGDMIQRGTEYDGLMFTLFNGWPDYLSARMQAGLLWRTANRLTEYGMAYETWQRWHWTFDPRDNWPRFTGPGDYVPQHISEPYELRASFFSPNSLNTEKLVFLRQLQQLCHEKKLECLYLHGPMHQDLIDKSRDYFTAANSALNGVGFPPLCPLPLPLRANQVGDAYDHVHPDFQAQTTLYYAHVILAHKQGHPLPCNASLSGN